MIRVHGYPARDLPAATGADTLRGARTVPCPRPGCEAPIGRRCRATTGWQTGDPLAGGKSHGVRVRTAQEGTQ